MAGEWKETTLGECATWLSGGTPFKGNDAFWSGSIPWVSAKDMKSFRLHDAEDHISPLAVGSGGKLVPAGTILLLVRGMTLHHDVPICMVTREMAFNQDIKALRPAKNVDGAFLAYWLLANKPDLLSSVDHAGHGTGRFVTETLKAKRVNLPPLPEQRAIAHVLGTLDDLIELNRETNEILEEMARALFKSWFVDFDPVRAKLEGRPPAGMDAATAALFPDHFQDSELGQIPKGWENANIGDLCEINGWTLGKKDKIETLEYVEISEVNRGNIASMATYLRGTEPSRARRRLRHGDTVLSTVRPDRGAYFLALSPPENRVASTGFAVLTPSKAPWSFVHAAMTQPEVSDHLGHLADGGAYPAVRPEIISGVDVVVPKTPAIFEAFHKVCAPLFEVAESNRLESRDLATLRDALLPKLLSGEVKAPAAEELIAASA